jgi:hypothetical protein
MPPCEGVLFAVSCVKYVNNPNVVRDAASATPGLIPPPTSKLQVGEVCFAHANQWVWVEGYPAPGSSSPSSKEYAIRLYSEPGRGNSLAMRVGEDHLEPATKDNPKEVRVRTSEGVVADSTTRIVAFGQVKSVSGRDGECSLHHVSDVRLP